MNQAAEIYEQLWREAQPAFARGEPRLDSHLLDKAGDRRRGVSLAFRLSPAVRSQIKLFLDRLAADFPGQYFYQPDELHVTVLTFISTTDSWRREIRDLAPFRALLREIVRRHPPFKMEFRGVTAAPNAVVIQGFPLDDGLESIRAEIREGTARLGFAGRLDRRYPNRAAHVTAMRFRQPGGDWKKLAAIVQANRQTFFGETHVETLPLIWGDWYASADTTRILEEFPLDLAAQSR